MSVETELQIYATVLANPFLLCKNKKLFICSYGYVHFEMELWKYRWTQTMVLIEKTVISNMSTSRNTQTNHSVKCWLFYLSSFFRISNVKLPFFRISNVKLPFFNRTETKGLSKRFKCFVLNTAIVKYANCKVRETLFRENGVGQRIK